MSAAVLDLVEATVLAVDGPPAGMPVPAGVDLSRDYFPQARTARATRPPAGARSMVEVIAAIVSADRLVA